MDKPGTFVYHIEIFEVKTRKPRTVPLHEHLIEQGFLEFAIGERTGTVVLQGAQGFT
jgi:hypothetical protein